MARREPLATGSPMLRRTARPPRPARLHPCRLARCGALALALGALLLAACDLSEDARNARRATELVADGSARRALQAHFDANPQCAGVLSASPARPLLLEGDERLQGVRALLEAGLIARAEAALPGGEAASLFEPAPAARRFFRTERLDGTPTGLSLCYAKREVTATWTEPGSAPDGPPRLRYAFRLVDAPPWTEHPAMRTAFPFLEPVLSAEMIAQERLPFRDGAWSTEAISPVNDTLLWFRAAFYACPLHDPSPPRGCEAWTPPRP